MKSPFPGMDPFIEGQGLWPDFHQRLMSHIADQVSEHLPSGYVARLGHRTYIDRVADNADDEDVERRHFEPDVSVLGSRSTTEQHSAALFEPQDRGAILMHAEISEVPVKEVYLDIFEVAPRRRPVTSLEVLSPANKRYRGTGWRLYARKRSLFLRGLAHLVEIDLLRHGRRHSMREPWPDSPYYALVCRRWRAPACDVWTGHSTKSLPQIPVPLELHKPELVLDLQSVVNAVYEVARYSDEIDYRDSGKVLLSDEGRALVTTLQ